MPDSLVALVTGTSSGFGRATAEKLLAQGYRVFGTSRKPTPDSTSGIEWLQLDVASDVSVTNCVDAALARAGKIDVLVNNAGQSHRSLLEETPMEVARSLMEINFWGPVRMIRAVLPGMRERKSGTIVNVSSLAGMVGTPGQGFYAASKHALEGYTETLRAEIGHLPIRLALVEPGFFRTALHASMHTETFPVSAYDAIRPILLSKIEQSFEEGGDAETVAETIVNFVRCGDKSLRHKVGSDARKVTLLKKWLPEGMFISGMRKQFGLDATE